MRRRTQASLGVCLLGLATCQAAVTATGQVAPADRGLQAAIANYPPLIVGANTQPADGSGPLPRPCPVGGRVEQRGGLVTEYLGPDPASPDLCRMRIGGQEVEGWYGIWLTTWPGAGMAHDALARLIHGRTGQVEAFDVDIGPGRRYHDIQRNEGIESILLLGHTYRAMKISHYREGADGNTYRSVSTAWKDLATGMILYATYQHISGIPEIDVPIIPAAIVAAP